METSELEMTPPDSPKATKEEQKKTEDAPAPAAEEDLLGDLFPKAPPRDYWSSIFYDRDYWSNYKTPEEGGQAFHAQNGEPKSPRARARARERWPRLKGLCKPSCCA